MACDQAPASNDPLRPRSEPIEYVGLSATRAIAGESAFLDVVGPLFGEPARSGTRHQRYMLDQGLLLTSSEDTRTPDQAIVTLEMVTTDTSETRTILRVPVSYQYGGIYIETVRAALAQTASRTAAGNYMNDWHLDYNVVSANGGSLLVRVAYASGEATLMVQTESPRASLRPGEVNTAAFSGDPAEVVGGEVNFDLSRDEFDFFSSRAYGVSSGAAQNFSDFHLVPHDWLRITVTPMIDDAMVDVAFEVVALDGSRLAFARAPASYVAGDQFRQNVFRMLDNMQAQETAAPGSSRPFTVPFYYDDPAGGGVVRVIATGHQGHFSIAYAVDSPVHRLREVDYVPFMGDPLANVHQPPPTDTSCIALGTRTADMGRFRVTFDASRVVRNSSQLTVPLRGAVYGSVFRSQDVTISGPIDGAVAVASFQFPDVDLTDPDHLPSYLIDTVLPAGDYQILGFLDIDANSTTGDPDEGDPVTLPIGGYPLRCEEQPVVVEFALLLPAGV